MLPQNLSILVVDDNDDDVFMISNYLESVDTFNIIIDKEINYNAARGKILKNIHDIYIIDYLLGPETGIKLMTECINAGISKPFILLTGKGDKQIDIEAAKAGAYDYLTKTEINAESLERSLRYSVQRYLAYTAVLESEKRYKEIFVKSNDIIFVIDEQFKLLNFNPMMNTLLGYSTLELIHQPIGRFFETPDAAVKFVHYVETCNSNSDIEIVLRTKDGIRKTFIASCAETLSVEGQKQYQGILFDYTSMKKSVADQLLREKIETSGRLVQSLAHEIRNPLTNIDLSAHQLESGLPDEMKIFTDIIKRNSKRINDLIVELMNFSKPAKNNYEKLEIKKLVRASLASAIDRIQLKEIEVVEQLEPENLFIWGDGMKLQTAILNVIINAVEAMEAKKGRLTVETSEEEDMAVIKISDNGSGISQDNLSQLFHPYFTMKKNGLGLGLATTHNYIEAHKGVIEVESTSGEGTTFFLKLRLLGVETPNANDPSVKALHVS